MVVASELFENLLGERWVFCRVLASSLSYGGKIFPVDRVIDVSSKVKLNSLAKSRHFVVVEVSFSF